MRRFSSFVIVAVVSAGATWVFTRPAAVDPPPTRALSVTLPAGHDFAEAAISPDGSTLVYTAIANGRMQLFRRTLNTFTVEPLPGTEGATQPFFAPDGGRVGFFASGVLRWIAVDGGPPVDVIAVAGATAGATWGLDDQIVFGSLGAIGLQRVSATPSPEPTIEEITLLDTQAGELSHGWPQLLPDGRSLVFTVGREDLDPRLAWMGLDTDESDESDGRELLAPADGAAFYVDSGHLVYARRGEIFAMPVDAGERAVTGPARLVANGVASSAAGHMRLGQSALAAARTGLLVYARRSSTPTDNLLAWVDRSGSVTEIDGIRARHQAPRISPNGSQLAMTVHSGPLSRDLWTYDLATRQRRQLTQDAGDNHSPVWSMDGDHLTFASNRDGPQRIYRTTASGRAPVETLIFGDSRTPGSWSPDGRHLFFHEFLPEQGRDIWVWTGSSGESSMLLGSNANERSPAISPDGRWLAYVSDARDGDQVYVRPYPGSDDIRISPTGGAEPVWSKDGSELFYRSGRDLFAVTLDADTGDLSRPARLFAGSFVTDPGGNVPSYDVSPDGSRFVMLVTSARTASLDIVEGWQSVVFDDPGEP